MAVTLNERKTEALVEVRLRGAGYFKADSKIAVERQSSDSPRIRKLSEYASKRGGGVGKPEFLIHSPVYPDFLVVVECKADSRKHVSPTLNNYAEYAVDGALLYASFLAKEFDVLAVGVSGQDESTYRISHFLHLRGAKKANPYHGARDILSLDEYYQEFINSDVKFRQDYDTLLDYSRTLNNQLQAKKVTEADRAFLISGIPLTIEPQPI